jgi:hypothetical protein
MDFRIEEVLSVYLLEMSFNRRDRVKMLQLLLVLLPIENRSLLKALMAFFYKMGYWNKNPGAHRSLIAVASLLLKKGSIKHVSGEEYHTLRKSGLL